MESLFLSSILPRPKHFARSSCRLTSDLVARMRQTYERFQLMKPNYISDFSFSPESLRFKQASCRQTHYSSTTDDELSF